MQLPDHKFTRRNVVKGVGGAASSMSVLGASGMAAAQSTGELTFESIEDGTTSIDGDLEFYFTETETVHNVSAHDLSTAYDFANLPETGPFVVYVRPSETYYPNASRKYVPGVEESATAYLIHENHATNNVQFQLNDYTGLFPKEETILQISMPVSGNFVEISSDFFGATSEYEIDLKSEARHQLAIMNTETGDTRHLGVITPNTDQLYTLDIRPERAQIIEEGKPLISVSPSARTLSASQSSTVTISIEERDSDLDEWTAIITYETDGSSTELYNQTHANTTTEISPTLDLEDRSGGQINVSVEAVTMDGGSATRGVLYRVREFIDHDRSLLSVLGVWGDEFGTQDATTFIAVIGSVLITGGAARSMRVSREALGGIALLSLLGFAVIGWAPYTLIFACGVTYATLWAILRGL